MAVPPAARPRKPPHAQGPQRPRRVGEISQPATGPGPRCEAHARRGGTARAAGRATAFSARPRAPKTRAGGQTELASEFQFLTLPRAGH